MENQTETKIILEENIRHSFSGVVWTHKIQEKQADIYGERASYLELCRIIANGITSVGLITTIFINQNTAKIITVLISFASVIASSLLKNFDLLQLVSLNKKAASELVVLRDKYLFLLMEVKIDSAGIDYLLEKYSKLETEKYELYKVMPQTTDKAVDLAREALNIKKDNQFTVEETNSFLPDILKRNNE